MFKKVPHTYVIIFGLIVLAAIATWFVPAGEFLREKQVTESGKVINGVINGSYHRVDQAPQTWQVMSAFFKGFQKALQFYQILDHFLQLLFLNLLIFHV